MSEQTLRILDIRPGQADADASALDLLRRLNAQPELSHRELSQSLGLSLGKTHYVLHALLHALLDRGLVDVRNFRRSDNKLGYACLLTPAGLGEKRSLTRRFLARKEQALEQLQGSIAALCAEIDGAGPAAITVGC